MKIKFPQILQNKNKNDDIEVKVLEAQNGDKEARNEILDQYQPFVKRVVSEVCKRYVHDSMEEFSVGLLAFNEAIDGYKNEDKSSFMSFSGVVIKRRIIDHIRKEKRYNDKVSVWLDSDYKENDFEEHYVQQKRSLETYEIEQGKQERETEIQEYQKLLRQFSVTFADLVKKCPKHRDARENAKLIAKIIAEDKKMVEELMIKKYLPIQKVEPLVSSSRKTIERNRKYIIAITLIYVGGFASLKSYVEPKGEVNGLG